MNKNNGKPNRREAVRLNKRAFILLFRQMPSSVSSRLGLAAWDAVTPYIAVYLSALLINELSGARNINSVFKLIVIILASSAFVSLVSALLKKWRDTECSVDYYKIEHIFSEKMMSMDFVDADNPQTHEKFSAIAQYRNSSGWGLNTVCKNIEELIGALFTMLGGIALTITLFTSRVPMSAENYSLFNNAWANFTIIAALMGLTIASSAVHSFANGLFVKEANLHSFGNRIFGYFGWFSNIDKAADTRIYRLDLICDKYNNRKDGVFGTKGHMAKLSNGPIGLLCALSQIISTLSVGIIYLFVCLKALGGAFGIGLVTQYIAAITKFTSGVSNMIKAWGEMYNNAFFLKLTFEALDIPNNMYQGSLTVEKRSDCNYEIEFRNVSFKYPQMEDYVLRHINLKFKIGQRLAVVGQNGSGKTTFIKLLCRLYDPTEGEILLNGIDIRKYNYAEYISVFSVVFQDFVLFAQTLGQNVAANTVYNKNLTQQCLEKVGFGEKLKALKGNTECYLYKKISTDGVEISGGEAQKIALARAVYKNAPFMILDEPTAALDPVAEAEIYTNFNRIVGDKTAVFISHRLSSCRFCDDILVFDKGEVVQQGSHEALQKQENGKYHELWFAQAQYYN